MASNSMIQISHGVQLIRHLNNSVNVVSFFFNSQIIGAMASWFRHLIQVTGKVIYSQWWHKTWMHVNSVLSPNSLFSFKQLFTYTLYE